MADERRPDQRGIGGNSGASVDPRNERPVLVARQPIVDRRRRLLGYELLFRGRNHEGQGFDGNRATAQMMTEHLMSGGLRDLVGGSIAFVNFTEELLLSGYPSLLAPPESFVVEVLEDVTPSAEVIAECRRIRKAGFRVALDDVIDSDRIAAFRGQFDYVKVDLLDTPEESLSTLIDACRKSGASPIAEKIESDGVLQRVHELGFDYFQGYALATPATFYRGSARALPVPALRLLEVMSEPELSLADLESAVTGDPALAYRVLVYANSASAAQRRQVDSIRTAIILIGQDEIRRVASLLVLTGISGNVPSHLVDETILLSQFCEGVAPLIGQRKAGARYAFCGLLSTLDRLLGIPMLEVIDRLRVTDDIRSALLNGTGKMGATLALASRYLRGEWAAAEADATVMGIATGDLAAVFEVALRRSARLRAISTLAA